MSGRVFVDTNVLVYAHDSEAGRKHDVAKDLMKELWSARKGTLSTQVLQEFYVNVTRKIPKPLAPAVAREVVRTYGTWEVAPVAVGDIVRASEVGERYRISFWDALIVVAATKAGASKIASEDLNPGQRIEGVAVENPFAVSPT